MPLPDIPKLIDIVLTDLVKVASSSPNERLPKEEQIRCSIYAALKEHYEVVCAERGYGSIDEGSRTECDLWAYSPDSKPVWIEFKRCWGATGWVNKPPEQLRNWEADIDKLRQLPVDSDRYFILVGLFDCDPTAESGNARNAVADNIRGFCGSQLVHKKTKSEFRWRADDGLNCIGAWVWHWPVGKTIDPTTTPVKE